MTYRRLAFQTEPPKQAEVDSNILPNLRRELGTSEGCQRGWLGSPRTWSVMADAAQSQKMGRPTYSNLGFFAERACNLIIGAATLLKEFRELGI